MMKGFGAPNSVACAIIIGRIMQLNFIALGLYSIAALGGLIMAIRTFQEKPSPTIMAILHFLFAGSASVTLALFAFGGQTTNALFKIALALYGAAALGGLFLASFRFGDKYPPKFIVLVHALVAVSGTVVLLQASFG